MREYYAEFYEWKLLNVLHQLCVLYTHTLEQIVKVFTITYLTLRSEHQTPTI